MNTGETGNGFIQVAVSSGEEAFPIEAAIVYIKGDNDGGENGIIYSLRTDRSGLTAKVSLPAPPKSLSQTPGSAEKPYSTYNIEVSKEGYNSFENVSVPVFDGILSLQKINLIPEPDYAYLSKGYPDENRKVVPAPEESGL